MKCHLVIGKHCVIMKYHFTEGSQKKVVCFNVVLTFVFKIAPLMLLFFLLTSHGNGCIFPNFSKRIVLPISRSEWQRKKNLYLARFVEPLFSSQLSFVKFKDLIQARTCIFPFITFSAYWFPDFSPFVANALRFDCNDFTYLTVL